MSCITYGGVFFFFFFFKAFLLSFIRKRRCNLISKCNVSIKNIYIMTGEILHLKQFSHCNRYKFLVNKTICINNLYTTCFCATSLSGGQVCRTHLAVKSCRSVYHIEKHRLVLFYRSMIVVTDWTY